MTEERYYVLFMVDSCMGDKRNTQEYKLSGGPEEKYYVYIHVYDSCMGDKRNTQDINCSIFLSRYYVLYHVYDSCIQDN